MSGKILQIYIVCLRIVIRAEPDWAISTSGLREMAGKRMTVIVMDMQRACGPSVSIVRLTTARMRITTRAVPVP